MINKIIVLFAITLTTITVYSQNTFNAILIDSATNEVLFGATAILKGTTNGSSSDLFGKIEINNVPDGVQTIEISFLGYTKTEIILSFPISEPQEMIVFMKPIEEEIDEVIVATTRTSRTIQNEPTRIEMIELEEIDEKTNMRPSNVAMILNESTGIQVQQTSATSGNASIRIQGLDGRYTQILKDGYPNFGNFASGLSILEIPPLDLKQVEIIKGPASTLYGAGAIAGVINFISKTPGKTAEQNFIINQSHIGQTNLGSFFSHQLKKFGYTILAIGNLQKPYDVDRDKFTELPKSTDFTIHPKVFFYPSDKSTFIIGNSFTAGERTGGDISLVKGKPDSLHTYFENNKSTRNIITFSFEKKLNEKNNFNIKASYSFFDREISLADYKFSGKNYNLFTDISYVQNRKKQTLIIGTTYINEIFCEDTTLSFLNRNLKSNSAGIYTQLTWDISEKVKLESGFRADATIYKNYNFSNTEYFLLPRISTLINLTNKFSLRVSGGLGYKTPTVFTEQTEAIHYRKVLPLNNISSEKSYGSTADFNYKTSVNQNLFFSVNHMLFYTLIKNATVLQTDSAGNYFFVNADKPVNSLGFETNLKFIFKDHLKFFAGYTFTDAKAKYLTGNQHLPLLPKNKLNLALVYEKENFLKVGLEGYFTDSQFLSNGTSTPSFWEFGAMAEKPFGKISVFLNFENFTDTKQSNYKRVVNEPINNPTFDEIWTHTEGFVMNGGIKLKL